MLRQDGPLPSGANDVGAVAEYRAFLDELRSLRSLCRRETRPLSIVMFDLDGFRRCNERQGREFGDNILRWFTSILTGASRGSDLVARIYADRFVVALPGATTADAGEVAQHCRRILRSQAPLLDGQPYDIDVSFGIAESTAQFHETETQLLQRARIALERAKHGRGHHSGMVKGAGAGELPAAGGASERPFRDAEVSRWVERLRGHLRATYMESMQALVAAVDAKDPYTRTHSLAVARYAEELSRRMGLPARLIDTVRAAALLHDVGKIGIPDAILTKPAALTPEEFQVIKRHPQMALDILDSVSFLRDEKPYILHHHERYDGDGYPAGLKGDQIPIGARIIAVVDALDTMLSPRAYKQRYGIDQVRRELRTQAGRQFDAVIVHHMLRWLDEKPDAFR